MASNTLQFLSILLIFSSLISSSIGRRLPMSVERSNSPAMDGSLFLAALPKGTVPSSTPSKRGNSATIDEKLIARHLAAVDRILRSVPSPGVGH